MKSNEKPGGAADTTEEEMERYILLGRSDGNINSPNTSGETAWGGSGGDRKGFKEANLTRKFGGKAGS